MKHFHFYLFKKYILLANDFFSPLNTQSMHIVIFYTTALLCFLKYIIPWRDSNPGLLVPEADAMSTMPHAAILLLPYICTFM
jgi:hypothetical protein